MKIDLDEFEEKFTAAHTPIQNTIKILCKNCHRKYDAKTGADKSSSQPDLSPETDMEK